jgi:glucokinase
VTSQATVFAVGVDIGATKFAAGVVDSRGNLTDYAEAPLASRSYPDLISLVGRTVKGLSAAGVAFQALGVGLAGWLSPARDVVREAAILGWSEVALRDDLQLQTGLPTVANNDADCAAWAEWVAGGRRTGSFALLTLGTDVGGGVVVNGQLVTGAHGVAGELGHLTVKDGGTACVCGREGCLAVYASGTAMLTRARALVAEDPTSAPVLARLSEGDPARLRGVHLQAALAQGDRAAQRVVGEAAAAIATASHQISLVIDHDELVLGGGASGLGAPLVAAVTQAMDRAVPLGPIRLRPRVRLASTGNRAGVLGAGSLALEHMSTTQPVLPELVDGDRRRS